MIRIQCKRGLFCGVSRCVYSFHLQSSNSQTCLAVALCDIIITHTFIQSFTSIFQQNDGVSHSTTLESEQQYFLEWYLHHSKLTDGSILHLSSAHRHTVNIPPLNHTEFSSIKCRKYTTDAFIPKNLQCIQSLHFFVFVLLKKKHFSI